MKTRCPLCNREVTYRSNLIKHLAGESRYGGHRKPIEEAERIAQAVFNGTYEPDRARNVERPEPPVTKSGFREAQGDKTVYRKAASQGAFDLLRTGPQNRYEYFLEELFVSLVRNKELPKYQFERRIDAVLDLFLPDLLTAHFRNPVEMVVSEFPLKKDDSHLSTNVDSLLCLRDGASDRIRYWLFLELKTDDASVRDEQIDVYERAMRRSMPSLVEDIVAIRARSDQPEKYSRLIERLSGIPAHDLTPVRFIYLAPTRPPRLRLSNSVEEPRIYPLTFAQLEGLPVKQFPEAWVMFCRIVMPYLKSRR